MNKIASILLAGLLAIVILGGFIALVGGSVVGAIVFVIGIPVAFPMTTSVVVLFFTVIIIRTVIEKRRQKREMRKYRSLRRLIFCAFDLWQKNIPILPPWCQKNALNGMEFGHLL